MTEANAHRNADFLWRHVFTKLSETPFSYYMLHVTAALKLLVGVSNYRGYALRTENMIMIG
jgi:hypothetical protein